MKTRTLDLTRLDSKDPKVKYGFAKELLETGKKNPRILYEGFDYWTDLMKSKNNILRWTAIDILGCISAVDKDDKTIGQIKNLFKILHCGNLITCNHAIYALGLIAKNKPGQRSRIIKELVTISKDTFDTEECKCIAAGKVIDTLNDFAECVNGNPDIMKFIQNAQSSQRNATRKKADALMLKINKQIHSAHTTR